MADAGPTVLTDKERKEMNWLKSVSQGNELTEKGNKVQFTPKRKARLDDLLHIEKNPREAELSTGAKTYATNWLHDRIYRRRREFSAEETEKGNRTENEGFELIKEYLNDPFMREHPDRVIGKYIEGECDILSPTVLYDNKSAFTHETMPLLTEKVKRAHWCQLQGYCHLYGYKRAARAYTLTNMPEDMIERKALFATKAKYGPDFLEFEYKEQLERLTKKYTYDDQPIELRVMITEFDYEPEFIKQVIDRVKWIRRYIEELEREIPERILTAIKNHRKLIKT